MAFSHAACQEAWLGLLCIPFDLRGAGGHFGVVPRGRVYFAHRKERPQVVLTRCERGAPQCGPVQAQPGCASPSGLPAPPTCRWHLPWPLPGRGKQSPRAPPGGVARSGCRDLGLSIPQPNPACPKQCVLPGDRLQARSSSPTHGGP